jgi:hypothetical protein
VLCNECSLKFGAQLCATTVFCFFGGEILCSFVTVTVSTWVVFSYLVIDVEVCAENV